jgi:hypothetical protein
MYFGSLVRVFTVSPASISQSGFIFLNFQESGTVDQGGDSTTPLTSDLSPHVCVFESIDPDAVERRYPRLSATGLSPGPSRFETEYTCYESRDDGLLRFTAGSWASTENLYYFNLTMTSAGIRCRLNVGAEPPVAQVLHLGEGDTEGVSARPTFAAWPCLILARCSGGWLS